ncbi:Mediator of RNA polymerase II transcription subunit 6, partial [Halocaridina rubra]
YEIFDKNAFLIFQLATLSNLTSAFTELQSFSHYHPSRGYWWQFRNQGDQAEQQKKVKGKKPTQSKKEEKASLFQNQRVSPLLEDLQAKFPYKYPTQPQASNQPGQLQAQTLSHQVHQPQSQQQQNQQQQSQQGQQQETSKTGMGDDSKGDSKVDVKVEIKQEPSTQPVSRMTKPPPEKRQRTGP